MQPHFHRAAVVAGALAFALAGPGLAAAQVGVANQAPEPAIQEEGPRPPQGWGTTTLSVLNLNAFAFEPFDGAAVAGTDSTSSRFMVAGNTCFEASLNLPTGAIIDHTELEHCDTNATNNNGTTIFFCANGSCGAGYLLQSAGTPGCERISSAVGSTVINNTTNTYFAQVCTGFTGSSMRFRALRVFYRLQVSPAPATATFPLDVPTGHPFFRFVEALAASGLTGGCGTGSFCPDQPVTRGQLSVFLASALGLHFPN